MLGLSCVTCNNGRTLTIGNSGRKGSTGTFLNYKNGHCSGRQHEKARAAIVNQIEQHPSVWESTGDQAAAARVRAATLLFSARTAGRASFEPSPRADLTPIGAEPGPHTRGSGSGSAWAALAPELPEDAQDQLDRAIGRGVFLVNAEQTFAACQRCPRFNRTLIQLSNPDDSGQLSLCDPAQGPMLDEALTLTQPSKKAGSKRTRGEEVVAEKAKRARQAAPPEGQRQVQPTEVARAPGKRRATHAPGMR